VEKQEPSPNVSPPDETAASPVVGEAATTAAAPQSAQPAAVTAESAEPAAARPQSSEPGTRPATGAGVTRDAAGRVTIRKPTPANAKSGALWHPTVGYGARRIAPLPEDPPTPTVADAGVSPLAQVIISATTAPANAISPREASPKVVVISGSAPSTVKRTVVTAEPVSVTVTASAAAAPGGTSAAPPAFRVGPYEVATRVARGGMGSIYVCRLASEPDRLLTMKVVRQHGQQDLSAASFRHEALIGSLFKHANAQTVLDSGIYESQPYLVLDYVEGCSLADLLRDETRLTPAITVAIVLDVLAALQALHRVTDGQGRRLGIIHCDVSPENILVGVDGVARLADFGSARITSVAKEAAAFAVSKPAYMPPEQFRGEPLDSRSDLYSTGVLLWTALTGQQPFAGESYDEMLMNVMRKKIKPPSAHGAPACLDDVCMQALNRFAGGRFVVADAMASALRAAAIAGNLLESREGVGQWVRRVVGDELAQRRRRINAAFAGGKTADAGLAPRTAGQRTPSKGSYTAPTPPQGARKLEGARTLFMPGAEEPPGPGLTSRQRTIIAVAAGLTFALTVAIGVIVSRPSAGGARASAAAEANAALPRTAGPQSRP
jgi:serine/threonine-protein kinase